MERSIRAFRETPAATGDEMMPVPLLAERPSLHSRAAGPAIMASALAQASGEQLANLLELL